MHVHSFKPTRKKVRFVPNTIEHYPRATKLLEEDGTLIGYDAGCSCGWRGRTFLIEEHGNPAARTLAFIVGNGHMFAQQQRTAQ